VQAVVRRQCVYVVKNLYDLFRLGRLTLEEVNRVTRVEGRQLLFDALEAGEA